MKVLNPRLGQTRKKPMTVCIASVCGLGHPEGPFVIAAADRMITIGDLEYEPAQTKMVHFATQTIALFAGDMQLHAAVVPRVVERIREIVNENDGIVTVQQIADAYADEFGYYRRAQAEREILVPRGLNFERFLSKQSIMAHYQVAELDARLESYYINSSVIIAGIDHIGLGGHLYKVENPGIARCYDTPYFAAIGSGEALATTQFMFSKFDKTWSFPRALWLTFSAKARAEAAGGVGKQTDLALVGKGGRIIQVPDSQLKVLYELFETVVGEEQQASGRAVGAIEEYLKSVSTPAPDSSKEQTATEEKPVPDEPS